MFMLKSTHERELEAHRAATALLLSRYVQENDRLRAQMAERQVPAVRGSRGRFVKREG